MRYHFFLHYGWFLQNFEKDFIPTLLHTTVSQKSILFQKIFWPFNLWINCSSYHKNFANSRASALNFKSLEHFSHTTVLESKYQNCHYICVDLSNCQSFYHCFSFAAFNFWMFFLLNFWLYCLIFSRYLWSKSRFNDGLFMFNWHSNWSMCSILALLWK